LEDMCTKTKDPIPRFGEDPEERPLYQGLSAAVIAWEYSAHTPLSHLPETSLAAARTCISGVFQDNVFIGGARHCIA